MIIKLFKRNMSLLLILVVALMNSNTVFAKENKVAESNGEHTTEVTEYLVNVNEERETSVILENKDIVLLDNSPVTGVVPSNGYIDLYPTLESYIGFNKKFVVNATSSSSTGVLFVYLYKPNGNLQSNDWVMSVNEIVKWSVFLPSSGTWRVRLVAQATTAPVNVYVRWE